MLPYVCSHEEKRLIDQYIRGWLIITTITDARSFLHGMEAITKH